MTRQWIASLFALFVVIMVAAYIYIPASTFETPAAVVAVSPDPLPSATPVASSLSKEASTSAPPTGDTSPTSPAVSTPAPSAPEVAYEAPSAASLNVRQSMQHAALTEFSRRTGILINENEITDFNLSLSGRLPDGGVFNAVYSDGVQMNIYFAPAKQKEAVFKEFATENQLSLPDLKPLAQNSIAGCRQCMLMGLTANAPLVIAGPSDTLQDFYLVTSPSSDIRKVATRVSFQHSH